MGLEDLLLDTAAVAIGGALGAISRWLLARIVQDGHEFPWAHWPVTCSAPSY